MNAVFLYWDFNWHLTIMTAISVENDWNRFSGKLVGIGMEKILKGINIDWSLLFYISGRDDYRFLCHCSTTYHPFILRLSSVIKSQIKIYEEFQHKFQKSDQKISRILFLQLSMNNGKRWLHLKIWIQFKDFSFYKTLTKIFSLRVLCCLIGWRCGQANNPESSNFIQRTNYETKFRCPQEISHFDWLSWMTKPLYICHCSHPDTKQR